MKRFFTVTSTLFIALLACSLGWAQLVETGLNCKYIYPIQKSYLDQHVSINAFDNILRNRIVDQYLKHLDPAKIYFVKDDVDATRKETANLIEDLKAGRCGFLDKIESRYMDRVKERLAFVKEVLDKKFKVDTSVEIETNYDKREWPKSAKEANEFLKKYIHFQVANYMVTDLTLEEARGNVIRNYERALKRLQEKKPTDIYSEFLNSFAESLDPHSSYFSKKDEEDFDIQMSLSLEGIGATLSSQDGFTVVESLVAGGAAARSGQIQPQDKIIAVAKDGEKGKLENVIEFDLRDVVSRIRGKKGSKVKLLILRKKGDKKEKLEVTLVRDKIKLEDEAANIYYFDRVINGEKKVLGVINLPSFYAGGGRSSANDMKKLLVEARKKNVAGLVLDFSFNPGGSLDDAVKIAGQFFKTGNVVKQSVKEMFRTEVPLADTDPTVDFAGPLVVLITRTSASASEIVAGTLQDYKRALVVGGDHTFGKGTVQTVFRLPQDLGALKFTIGMFFIPGGNSTQHIGVASDIKLPSIFNNDEIGEKTMEYSLPPKKIASFISPDAYVKSGPGAWTQIDPKWVKPLEERSKERVSHDADFKKIEDEIEKAQKAGKILKVADVLKDKEATAEKTKKAKAARTAPKAERDKEYLDRADIKESVNILSDLITIESGKKFDPLVIPEPAKDGLKETSKVK